MIIINLTMDNVAVEDLVHDVSNVHIVGKLLESDYFASETKMMAILRDLLAQAEKTPEFNWHDDVIVVCRSSVLAMGLITGIKAAFSNVQVWAVYERFGKPVHLNLSQFEIEGRDYRNREEVIDIDQQT